MCIPHKTGAELSSKNLEDAKWQHWYLSVRAGARGLAGSLLGEPAFGWDTSKLA